MEKFDISAALVNNTLPRKLQNWIFNTVMGQGIGFLKKLEPFQALKFQSFLLILIYFRVPISNFFKSIQGSLL